MLYFVTCLVVVFVLVSVLFAIAYRGHSALDLLFVAASVSSGALAALIILFVIMLLAGCGAKEQNVPLGDNEMQVAFTYTESKCIKATECLQPDTPPHQKNITRWTCRIINRVAYRCLWPVPSWTFLSAVEYIEYEKERAEELTICTGVEKECVYQAGVGSYLRVN